MYVENQSLIIGDIEDIDVDGNSSIIYKQERKLAYSYYDFCMLKFLINDIY